MTLLLPECVDLAFAIASALPGTTVLLPPAECAVASTILVPPGVRIVGRPESVLVGVCAGPMFDLRASSDVEVRGIAVRLEGHSSLIRAHGGQRVRVADVSIEGNEDTAGTADIPILVEHMTDFAATRVRVTDSFGGIYASGERITVADSAFERVNYGNVVVGGSKVWVLRNSIEQPGLATANHAAGGDGITLTAGATYATVQGNTIRSGACYGISAPSGAANLVVVGNTVELGGTAGINLVSVGGGFVTGNVLRQNAGAGLLLDSPSYVVASENWFYGNPLWVAGSSHGQYGPNRYVLTSDPQYDGDGTDVIQ